MAGVEPLGFKRCCVSRIHTRELLPPSDCTSLPNPLRFNGLWFNHRMHRLLNRRTAWQLGVLRESGGSAFSMRSHFSGTKRDPHGPGAHRGATRRSGAAHRDGAVRRVRRVRGGAASLCAVAEGRPVLVRSRPQLRDYALCPRHTRPECRMSLQDGKIGQIRNTLDGWPCLFCGSFNYYMVIRCRASEDDGDLIARCRTCGEKG